MKTFNIYVPSYKRYDKIKTKNILDYCTYVVRQSEAQDYMDAGIEDMLAVEDSQIDSMLKVYQWIIDNTKEDIIVMIDDDISNLIYRTDYNVAIEDKETATAELERIAVMMEDLKIGFAGVDFTSRPYGYTQEFDFKGTAGGLVWINKEFFKAKPDPNVEYNEDCDKVLQELLHNRIILKPKYLCMNAVLDVNAGGSNEGKLRQKQLDSIEYMKLKWGRYFQYSFKNNTPNICVKR